MKVLKGIFVLLGMVAVLNAAGDGPKLGPLRPTLTLQQGVKGTPGREPAIHHLASLPETVPPCRYFEPEWTMPNDGHTIYAACAVQDTLLFLAHGYYAPNRILIYRISDFALVDSFLTPQVSVYGYIDFYHDKNEDVLYAGAYGLTNQFDRWNATTHAYIGRVSITGSQTPGSYCFAITGDGDSLYISGFDVGIYKCAKTGGNSHLVVVSPPQSATMGLAMARSRGIMFVSGSDTQANLYQYDCRNWAQIHDTMLDARLGGCECYRGDTFLVAVCQDPDNEVRCYRLIPSNLGFAADNGPLRTTDCHLRVTPNPSTGAALIRFSLPNSGNVSLKLYRVTGAEVMTLATGYHTAGAYSLTPSFSYTLARGIYLLRLETEHSASEQKLVLE